MLLGCQKLEKLFYKKITICSKTNLMFQNTKTNLFKTKSTFLKKISRSISKVLWMYSYFCCCCCCCCFFGLLILRWVHPAVIMSTSVFCNNNNNNNSNNNSRRNTFKLILKVSLKCYIGSLPSSILDNKLTKIF